MQGGVQVLVSDIVLVVLSVVAVVVVMLDAVVVVSAVMNRVKRVRRRQG